MATKYPAIWKPGGEFGYGTVINGPLNGERHITLPFAAVDALHPAEGGGHSGLDFGWYRDQLLKPEGNLDREPVINRLFGVAIAKGFNSVMGHYLMLRHGDPVPGTIATTNLHMPSPSPWNVGDFVPAGALIGVVNNTGLSTGPHLHFTVSVFSLSATGVVQYIPVDPLLFFGEEPVEQPIDPSTGMEEGEEADMKVIRRMDLAFAAVALEAAKLDVSQGQGTVDLIDTGNADQVGVLMIVTRDELLRALPGGF